MSGLVGQMKAIPPPSKETTPTTEVDRSLESNWEYIHL